METACSGDLAADFLSLFDDGLRREPNFVHALALQTARPRFATLLPLIAAEPFDALLEVGISNFIAIMHRLRPDARMVGLGLDPMSEFWFPVDGVRLIHADLLDLPPLDDLEPFDTILCTEVIEHVQGNPIVALGGLHGLLRPGGRLIVTTPNLARLFNRVKLLLGRTPLERIEKVPWGGHFREYTLSEMVKTLQLAGFRVEHAAYAPYWDTVDIYLQGGDRGFDAEGKGYYRPRFVGWKRALAAPMFKALERVIRHTPSLLNGMVFVARRPR